MRDRDEVDLADSAFMDVFVKVPTSLAQLFQLMFTMSMEIIIIHVYHDNRIQ